MQIGSFQLEAPLGEGGMGAVWSAHHVVTGAAAAVKLLLGERAGDSEYIDGFRREVQALAKLRHPGIVQVFDYGVLTRGHEGIVAGTPWLAMERADLGALQISSISSWAETSELLIELLDALAHAHARGLIHRDLKPENVLRTTVGEPRWLLSDFGLAHPRVVDGDEHVFMASAGTPAFIAPEQITGSWREWGPWTDLYALGCVTWLLLTGDLPFTSASVVELLWKHIEEEPARFQPRFPVPPGTEPLLRRLLAKSAAQRFACAVDVRDELQQLGTISAREHAAGLPAAGVQATGTTFQLRSADWPTEVQVEERAGYTPGGRPPHNGRRRPFPSFVRKSYLPSDIAGVGLLGLRTPPLFGRLREQQRLWAAATEASRSSSPRLVLLAGARSTGKTRLLNWIVEEIHERGAGDGFVVRHAECVEDAWSTALERMLSTSGLSRREVEGRLDLDLANSGIDAAGLAALLRPGGAAEEGDVGRFMGVRERSAVLRSAVSALSRDRTLVVGLDDLHLSFASIEMVCGWLQQLKSPVTFVGALPSVDAVLPVLGPVRDRVEIVELDELEPGDIRELVESLVPMESDSVSIVVEAVGGSPGLAVPLLEHLRDSSLWSFDGAKFRLPSDLVKADLQDLWASRLAAVERALGLPPEILECAALLGRVFDQRLWMNVATERLKNSRPTTDDVGNLVDAGILVRRGDLLSFTDVQFVSTLDARASAFSRKTNLVTHVAKYFEARGGTMSAISAARLYLEQDLPTRALEALHKEGPNIHRTERLHTRREFVQLAERCRAAIGEEREVTERERTMLLALELHEVLALIHKGDTEAAVVRCDRIAQQAEVIGAWDTYVESETLRATAYGAQEQAEEAARALRRAEPRLTQVRSPRVRALFLRQMGWNAHARDDVQGAIRAFSIAASVGGIDARTRALAWRGQAQVESDPGKASGLALRALDVFRAAGDRVQAGDALSLLGDITDDFEEAARYYLQAVEAFDQLGHFAANIARVNMANRLVRHDQPIRASEVYGAVLAAVAGISPFFEGVARTGLAASAALVRDTQTWDAEFPLALELAHPHPETASLAVLGLMAWSAAGDEVRRVQAEQLVSRLKG